MNIPKSYASVKNSENEIKKNELNKPRPLTAKKDETTLEMNRKAITPDRDGSTGKTNPTLTSLHKKSATSFKNKSLSKTKQPETYNQQSTN